MKQSLTALVRGAVFAVVALCSVAGAAEENPLTGSSVSQVTGVSNVDGGTVQNADWRTGRYSTPTSLDAEASSVPVPGLKPFGSQLFEGGFRGVRSDGLNANYRIVPGDQITLRIWGAIESEGVLIVDTQGNVFIPSVGPVNVKGLNSAAMDARVRAALRSVYPENVMVYTNLQGTQPVTVFVTGYVVKPGRYAGTPDDSVIHYLDLAGGVDGELGSYRDIRLKRAGEELQQIDLYPFLLTGQLDRLQFRDGDTLVVGERKSTVSVSGHVGRDYLYELNDAEKQGVSLLALARPKPGVSHVLVRGHRQDGPLTGYYDLGEFSGLELNDGDAIELNTDLRADTIVVKVSGSFYGPSRYAVPRDARLKELLDAIAVPKALTDTGNISMRRISVAERQQLSLDESLRRLESTYLTASSSTPQEASIRVQEAQLISQFIQRARTMEPTGQLVVAREGKVADIRLQDGDEVVIPEQADSLLISGEVLVPQSVVFRPGLSVSDYIKGAGGYTRHADEERLLVVRLNGEVYDASEVTLQAGDEILVLPKAPVKNLQLASTLSQILYQIAVVTKVVTDL